MKSDTIAAYVFKADIYCRDHILDALPTGTDQEFDGWKDLSRQPVEASLSELAFAFGFDREEEHTFDSDEFPKVVSDDQLDGDVETSCSACWAGMVDGQ